MFTGGTDGWFENMHPRLGLESCSNTYCSKKDIYTEKREKERSQTVKRRTQKIYETDVKIAVLLKEIQELNSLDVIKHYHNFQTKHPE